MFLLLLLTLTLAVDDPLATNLATLQANGYAFVADLVNTKTEAEGKCQGVGAEFHVCTTDQVYSVVYGDVGGQRYADMCHSGFVDAQSGASNGDEIEGLALAWETLKSDPNFLFFGGTWTESTAEENWAGFFSSKTYNSDGTSFCGGNAGWRPNVGAQAGSHCCTASIVATPKADAGTCSLDCSTLQGSSVTVNSQNGNLMDILRNAMGGNQRCAGACNSDACCETLSVPTPYRLVEGKFTSLTEADNACKSTAGAEFGVCHQDQYRGIYENSAYYPLLKHEVFGCPKGWMVNDYRGSLATSYGWKGFYNTNGGRCFFRVGGFIDDFDIGGTANAHCCVSSMKTVENIQWVGDRTELAEQNCKNEFHHTQVCTRLQHTKAGINEDWDTGCTYSLNYADNTKQSNVEGHYQHLASDTCQDSSIGWIDAEIVASLNAPNKLNAACCVPYALEAEDVPTVYVRSPSEDYMAGWSTGLEAENHCNSLGNGTFGICSDEQVAWVGTNLEGHTDMCRVGWAKKGGDYVTGFYHTTNGNIACGQAGEWSDKWRPSPPKQPLAHCCVPTVETVTVTAPHYYNGNWDYSYVTGESARAVCKANAGYDLCTMGQLQTVAVHGIYVGGEMVQREPEIGRVGWYRTAACAADSECDFTFGWIQGRDAYGLKAGEAYTLSMKGADGISYHCCDGFETFRTQPPTGAPSMTSPYLVTLAAPKGAAGNVFPNQASALAGCKAKDSSYILCNDQQVVHYAQFGFTEADLPVSGRGNWQMVLPNNGICTYGFVDGQQNTCGAPVDKLVGYFQVTSSRSCGSGWMDKSVQKNNNAFCCAPGLQVSSSHDFKADLGCPDVDCDFEWTTCSAECTKSYTIKPNGDAQGNGQVCQYSSGYTEACTGGLCVPTDCQGDFTPCDSSCMKTWKTTSSAFGGGHCNYANDQKVACAPGTGDCPRANDRDCKYDYTACTVACQKQFVVLTPAVLNGKCPHSHNSVHQCSHGEGLCPPTASCVADFSVCGSDCMQTWTITKQASGDGNCAHVDGYRENCVGGSCTSHTNCVGSWGSCDSSCIQSFTITTPSKGRGTCVAQNGATRICLPGTGACPVNRDCTGRWSTCSTSCVRTWGVITAAAGTGNSCFPDGYQETCSNGACGAVSELYESVPKNICTGLGLTDLQCSNLHFQKNSRDEFYVYAGGSYKATCVAYNAAAETPCPATKVCAGCLRKTVGSLKKIGRLLKTAMSQTDGMHPSCQTYKSCSAVSPGYTPPYGDVQYYKCDDNCYYMNTMYTCVCSTDAQIVVAELGWSFEDSFNFQNPSCEAQPTMAVEEIIDHQLCITEDMIEDLEQKIQGMPDVHEQLIQAEGEIVRLLNSWHSQIETLLKDNGSQEARELMSKLTQLRTESTTTG